MTLPKAFYAEPKFRAASPDFAKLKAATDLTLETPGIVLALAMDYYRAELFASEKDRDLACGPTSNADVRYFPTTRAALIRAGTSLDEISCGHPVDHPNFGDALGPIFEAAAKRLIKDLVQAPAGQSGIVTSTMISIARVRYTISVTSSGDWRHFSVHALSAFEHQEKELVDRTIEYLQGRLALQISPTLAKCN